MKKITLTFYFICLSTLLFSQNIKITGSVFDEYSKAPLSDVLIIVDNEILTYTNIEGKYIIELPSQLEKNIVFSHISYQTKLYKLNSLISNSEVNLFSKNNELEEVVISVNKIQKKEILKLARTNYKNQVRKEPYWSSVNLKQISKLKDSFPSYIEVDGNLFSLGDDPDVWNWPILVPEESRRTEENFYKLKKENTILKEGNQAYTHFGLEIFNSGFLLNYRFFENGHPLNKRGSSLYKFTLEDTIELNNDECYVINYETKKPDVNIKGRKFYYIRGQIIVTKENFTLKKVTSLFRRYRNKKKGIDVIFTINYNQIENIIYPKDISYKLMFSKIQSKGILNFKNINITERENYRNSISSNRFLFRFSQVYNNYNSSYWKNKDLIDDFLSNELNTLFKNKDTNKLFLNGIKQKLNLTTNELNTEQPEQEILSLMKRDID
ncbi:carboxypeptidase-like regulatory domain-containing protein [Winogradskyella sp. PC D3.3]